MRSLDTQNMGLEKIIFSLSDRILTTDILHKCFLTPEFDNSNIQGAKYNISENETL